MPFIFGMSAALMWADLVVCRAGAMTLAELQTIGKPAILVPFPFATDDHQLKNAQDYAASGAAKVLEDGQCDEQSLTEIVDKLFNNEEELAGMKKATESFSRPHAAQTIANDLLRLASRSQSGVTPEATDVP